MLSLRNISHYTCVLGSYSIQVAIQIPRFLFFFTVHRLYIYINGFFHRYYNRVNYDTFSDAYCVIIFPRTSSYRGGRVTLYFKPVKVQSIKKKKKTLFKLSDWEIAWNKFLLCENCYCRLLPKKLNIYYITKRSIILCGYAY